MVATYKVEVKNGQVRRKPGRAKGVKEVGPRLPAGARAKIKQSEREQARNLRLAALKRRQVQEALGGEDLPAGTSVNDLTPLEASELALQRQGMRQQAEQLRQQLAEQRAATAEIARLRSDLSTGIPSPLVTPKKAPPPVAPKPVTPKPSGTASASSSPALSPKSRKKAAAARKKANKQARQTAAASKSSPVGPRTRSQGGDGLLAGLRAAMDVAEQGNPDQAQQMIRSLQRSRLDPVNQALDYCRSCIE